MNNDKTITATVDRSTADLRRSYADTAAFYARYAQQFEPGSQGFDGNMAESAKYARMAAGSVGER